MLVISTVFIAIYLIAVFRGDKQRLS
jgi:hypothetical protein